MRMRNFLSLLLAGILVFGNLQSQVIFSEDFESTPGPAFPAGWTLFDIDGLTPFAPDVSFVTDAWVVFDDFSDTTNECATSTSWYNPAGAANDWMFTPAIALTTDNILSWDALAYDPNYPDGYEVRIALSSPTVSNALANAALFTIAAESDSWTSHSVNLQSLGYANQTVYIAFRNNSNDQFVLAVDNIVVEKQPQYDAAINTVTYPSEYTIIPLSQVQPLTLSANILNNGTQTINNVTLTVNIYDTIFANLYSATSTTHPSLLSGDSVNLSVPSYTPSTGQAYFFEYLVSMQQSDGNTANDAAYLVLLVSDSVYARDDGIVTGGLGSGGSGGYLGQQFEIVNPTSATSILFYVTRGYSGLRVRANIWSMSGGTPSATIGNTTTLTYPDDSARTYVLGMSGGPLNLSPGMYTVTLEEMDTTIALGQTEEIYTPGTTWVDYPTSPFGTWANNEDFAISFAKPYALRLNLNPSSCALQITNVNSTNVTCNGGNDGSATVVLSGASGSETYAWSGGGNAATKSNLTAGTYTITVTDGSCSASRSVTITQPTAISASVNTTDNTSCGAPNGSASVNASGGTPGYTYLWSNSLTGSSISGIGAGAYSVTVTDSRGCTNNASGTVANNQPAVTVTFSTVPNSDCNNANGTATANPAGGAQPYTYLWSFAAGSQTMQTATGLTGGNYTVTVTDANSCSASGGVAVGDATPSITITINSTTANTSCSTPNGAVTVSASGGAGPYTYDWDTGDSGATVTGLSGSNYSVTATDANGCADAITVTVGSTTPVISISPTSTTPNSSCGTPNGAATVSASGGSGPYTYLWVNGTVGATISGVTSGSYTVTATDNNQCTGAASITIGSTTPTVTISFSNVMANTNCVNPTGTATATASGGTGPYTYNWTGGLTGTTVSSLQAGSYTVTAQDAVGCTGTASTTIADNRPVLSVNVATSSVTSCVSNNGSATATTTGTVGTVTYQWSTSPLQTGATASNLAAGSYTVTATDQNSGCTKTATAVIGTNTPTVTVNISASNNVTNCVTANGSATAAASGGAGNFTYTWSTSPAQTGPSASGLAAGSYSVTATDQNGCSGTASATISDNTATVTVNTNSTPVTSCNAPNGSAVAVGTGGTSPYTYEWSGGQTASAINNLTAGIYSVTATDANECVGAATVTVTSSITVPTVTATATDETSAAANNGTATATPSGGTAPYTYTWSNNGTSPTISGLDAGTYMVTITDQNGCTASASATVQTDVGIGDLKDVVSFSLFPNPTAGVVNLNLELNEAKALSIIWHNVLGEVVMERVKVTTKSANEIFNLSSLPQGIYMVRIKAGNEEMMRRVTLVR